MKTFEFEAHYYKVTDEAITPTGQIDHYTAPTQWDAMEMALYTHRLHNGRAWGTSSGVIHCPSCGQIAIVKKPEPPEPEPEETPDQPPAFPLVETPDGLQYTFPADGDEFQPRLFG